MNRPNEPFDLSHQIELYRIAKKDKYTIGRLFLQGDYVCDTLELPYSKTFILGQNCIPNGTYTIDTKILSPKYKAYKPRIIDFELSKNILIHQGNCSDDTKGCILVGFNDVVGKVTNSICVFNYLYLRLKKYKYWQLKIQ